MILFFGTRTRRRVVGDGTFHCPYCYAQRRYEAAESRTWAHVFWIPLFPIGATWQSVRCTVCGGEWSPEVLIPRPA